MTSRDGACAVVAVLVLHWRRVDVSDVDEGPERLLGERPAPLVTVRMRAAAGDQGHDEAEHAQCEEQCAHRVATAQLQRLPVGHLLPEPRRHRVESDVTTTAKHTSSQLR